MLYVCMFKYASFHYKCLFLDAVTGIIVISVLYHYECVVPLATSSLQSGRFWALLTASVSVRLWDSWLFYHTHIISSTNYYRQSQQLQKTTVSDHANTIGCSQNEPCDSLMLILLQNSLFIHHINVLKTTLTLLSVNSFINKRICVV